MRWIGCALAVVVSLLGWHGALAGDVDPAKWAQLHAGMAGSDVERILGKPDRREQPASNRTTLTYGEIAPKGQIFPDGLAYVVWLDEKNNVDSIDAPFGDAAPRAGIPSKPKIFLPLARSVFTHYPRLVDVRWYPVTGTYPIAYEVAYEVGYAPPGAKLTWHLDKTLKTDIPYLSLSHGGGQPGRVKIRAKNSAGSGPWSDYAVFSFTR